MGSSASVIQVNVKGFASGKSCHPSVVTTEGWQLKTTSQVVFLLMGGENTTNTWAAMARSKKEALRADARGCCSEELEVSGAMTWGEVSCLGHVLQFLNFSFPRLHISRRRRNPSVFLTVMNRI